MTICCCSLAGTAACMHCPNNPASTTAWPQYHPWVQTIEPGPYPHPIMIKRITEEFDKDGKLIKRITIEEPKGETQ